MNSQPAQIAIEEILDMIVSSACPDATVQRICSVASKLCNNANARFFKPDSKAAPVSDTDSSFPIRDDSSRLLGTLQFECSCVDLEIECATVARIVKLIKLVLCRRENNDALTYSSTPAYVAMQRSTDAIIMTDADGAINYLNPAAESLLNCESRNVLGRSATEMVNFVDGVSGAVAASPLGSCLRHDCNVAVAENAAVVVPGQRPTPVQGSVTPVRESDGELVGTAMVLNDVSPFEGIARQLAYYTTHDQLTGLANRVEFERRLFDCIDTCDYDEMSCAVLQIDIDQLKVVNDTFGHVVGDELLRQVSVLIQHHVGPSDCVARLSGDEFGVLVCGRNQNAALDVGEAIRAGVEAFRFNWSGASASVRCSIGVVMINPKSGDAATVMSAADVACYTAKQTGRNQIYLYSDERSTPHHEQMKWVSRIAGAIDDDRFEIYFQPIVRLQPGAGVEHHEILLRMRDENGALVMPSHFIPAAEHYNLMPRLDRWVVRTVLETCADSMLGSEPYGMAINLSGKSLSDDRFLRFLVDELRRHNLPQGAICFEITETAAISDLSRVVYFMNTLRERGCTFSLDDFGSGMSSFTYLKTLPVDFLKIDGHFVRNMADDEVDASMVQAIGQVARSIGIATVAEQVESKAVLDRLRDLQIHYAQGYYIARPAPISEFDPARRYV